MAKKFKDLANACWKGYKAVGLKKKDGKMVPNCVPEETQMEELKGNQHKLDKNKNGKLDAHDFKLLRKEESELTEATVETKKYSWGTMKTVHHGKDFSIPLHPEHHKAIAKLKDQQEHKFKDETGRHWTAKRDGDKVHLHSANDGPKTTVKHADLKEQQAPVAPVPDRKYIKGTPEYKAYMATKKTRVGHPTNEEVEQVEEGYIVRYHNPKSEKHGGEKHFDSKEAAQKHADRGNAVDKVGGKYVVHKADAKGHITEVSSDMVKKARDAAFEKGKDDQGHRFVKKAYEKGQKESDAMSKKMAEEVELNERDEIQSSDYKVTASGKKVKAKHIVFHSQDDDKEEEKEDMKEEKLTDAEMKERERIVKGMKKGIEGFKQRYGDRAKEVMYATATKLAKEEVEELDEGILSKVAGKLANATGVTPQAVANSTISAINKKAPGTKMHGHPNFSKFKREVHAHISSAKNAEEAIRRSSDDHVKSLVKKHFTEEVEQIDEISKKTLGSYVKKASVDMANRSSDATAKRTMAGADYAHNISRGMAAKTADAHMKKDREAAQPDIKKAVQRFRGIEKAVGRLAKEELTIDEEGNLMSEKISYKQFLQNLEEALWPGTPEYKKKYGGTSTEKGKETTTQHGTATGTGSGVVHKRDYDKAEKEEQPEQQKRGRGRPAGSKSGARQ